MMGGAPPYSERPLSIPLDGEQLLGILATPACVGTRSVALVILVGGPQYRAGPHRHFVELARTVSAAGWPVLRFDVRGMGDSTGPNLGFEHQAEDIGAALDAMQRAEPSVRRAVLWGLCDGATSAAMYLGSTGDPRVSGLILLNPWVHSDVLEAQTQLRHWYGQRLLQASFWRKLFSGRLGWASVRGLWQTARQARGGTGAKPPVAGDFRSRMLHGIGLSPMPVLAVLSRRDATAQSFDLLCRQSSSWARALRQHRLRTSWLDGADHTLTDATHRDELARLTLKELETALALPVPGAQGRLQ